MNFHRNAAPGLALWMRFLLPLGEQRLVYYRSCLEALQRRLVALNGEVPEARRTETRPGRVTFWWEFLPGFWVAYRRRNRGWWLWKWRDILIVSISERPPAPGA